MLVYCFKLYRGHSADWTTINPVLEEGEPGWEFDYRTVSMFIQFLRKGVIVKK